MQDFKPMCSGYISTEKPKDPFEEIREIKSKTTCYPSKNKLARIKIIGKLKTSEIYRIAKCIDTTVAYPLTKSELKDLCKKGILKLKCRKRKERK